MAEGSTTTDFIVVGAGEVAKTVGRRLAGAGASVHLLETAVRGRSIGRTAVPGHHADYDRWARQGCTGWGWPDVQSFFPTPEPEPEPERSPAAEAFVRAALAAGHVRNDDCISGDVRGVGYIGRDDPRGQSASAVIAAGSGPGWLSTTTGSVDRIVVRGGRAVGVRYLADDAVTYRTAGATSEIVLAAGTVSSATILLRSGIGPADELRRLGVPAVCDLPGVGRNLHDQPLVRMLFAARGCLPAGRAERLEAQLYAGRSGPEIFADLIGGVRGLVPPGPAYAIETGPVAPRSRGTVRLVSPDPREPPQVDLGVLTDPHDLEVLCDAIELGRRLRHQPACELRGREVAPGPAVLTRAEIRDYARRSVDTRRQAAGTCRMGADELAVVDPRLRVYGVGGLRVADASVMPAVPAGGIDGPSLMVARKAAGLLAGSL